MIVARVIRCVALVAAAAGVMAIEGARQPSPGIGFAIAVALLGAAVVVGGGRNV